METKIRDFLDFQNLIQGFETSISRIENIRKRQSQDLRSMLFSIYDASKSAVKTGIAAAPNLAQPLVDDLSEMIEIGVETRRKNWAIKKKQEEENKANGSA